MSYVDSKIFERNIKLYLLSDKQIEINSEYIDIFNALEETLGNLKIHKAVGLSYKSFYKNEKDKIILKRNFRNELVLSYTIVLKSKQASNIDYIDGDIIESYFKMKYGWKNKLVYSMNF